MKRALATLAFLCAVAVLALAALPATDNFNRSNGALGTNWTINSGANAYTITSNQASLNAADSTSSMEHWNADSFGQDQYAQANLSSGHTGYYVGLAVRVNASAETGYVVLCDSGTQCKVQKAVAGTYGSVLGTHAILSAGTLVKLTATGSNPTVLNVYAGGVLIIGPISDSSSPITTGSAGIAGINGPDSASFLDNWEGGNATTAHPHVQVINQ